MDALVVASLGVILSALVYFAVKRVGRIRRRRQRRKAREAADQQVLRDEDDGMRPR